jgi:hypothetical protein
VRQKNDLTGNISPLSAFHYGMIVSEQLENGLIIVNPPKNTVRIYCEGLPIVITARRTSLKRSIFEHAAKCMGKRSGKRIHIISVPHLGMVLLALNLPSLPRH